MTPKHIEFKIHPSSKYTFIVEGTYCVGNRPTFEVDSVKVRGIETHVKTDKGIQIINEINFDEIIDEFPGTVKTINDIWNYIEEQCLERI